MENSNTTPLWRTLGLTDLEYEQIVSGLSREPNFTELAMFSVMWSEHCAYKNSKPVFISMLRGIIVPLVSSFNEDFSLDLQSMRAHIQYLLSQGVNGIFVNASTSEFFSMSPDEQIQIMKLAAEELEDTSSALITGVTSNSTEHSVKLAKMAQEMNFDAVVAAPPYYGAFGEEALYQHFRAIAEGSRLPLILYDIPSATGNPLPPSLVVKLAKENLAAGIKVTRDSLTYLLDILAIKEKYPSFSVLVGFDHYLPTNLLLGETAAL